VVSSHIYQVCLSNHLRSFRLTSNSCQFHVKSDTTVNATGCSHWTSSPDLTIQDLDNVACENDPGLTWSLTRPDLTGYNFDITWARNGAISFGTYWIPRSLVAWAWADGERVQIYAGPRSFVVPSN